MLSYRDGVHIHAAILNAITQFDSGAGQQLHDSTSRDFTIAVVDEVTVKINLIGVNAIANANLLVNALTIQKILRIGKKYCYIESIKILNSTSTWSDFLSEPWGGRFYCDFISPVSITKRDSRNNRFVALFPDPVDIFHNLYWCWQKLGGPGILGINELASFIAGGGCVISKHDLKTEKFRIERHIQIGFTGQTVYECRYTDNMDCIIALNALMRMANFTGIGYQTRRGSGAVQTRITGVDRWKN